MSEQFLYYNNKIENELDKPENERNQDKLADWRAERAKLTSGAQNGGITGGAGANQELLEALAASTEALDASTEALERATETIEHLEIRTRRSILDFTSTASARERNQRRQKEEARHYYGCVDPADPSRTVCMITGFPGAGKQVVNAHILPVRARSIMGDLGLLSRNIWDAYSCVLLVKPIEARYDNGDLVFLYDEEARCYRIYVLFKDLLTKGIENGDVRVTKSDLGLPGGNAVAVFGDIHGLPLKYPPSCAGPYNRLMLYIAKEYCREASEHYDFDDIVPNVIPTEVVWKKMREIAFIGSPESQSCLAMKRFMEEF